ncbi:MAG: hypothetical protein K9H49_07610 [Bacteroidales bacterium]|nr:hypothetical protein [Bacteroidales bacterium]MCF8404500.1 hypothetical protein [Bacteroidales bacterium]
MRIILFISIFFLIFLSIKAQEFNDTIITLAYDTIICNITFINENNVFYEYRIKKRNKSDHIAIDQTHYFTGKSKDLKEISRVESIVSETVLEVDKDSYVITRDSDTLYNKVCIENGDTIHYVIDFGIGSPFAPPEYIAYYSGKSSTFYYANQILEYKVGEQKFVVVYIPSQADPSGNVDKNRFYFAQNILQGKVSLVRFWVGRSVAGGVTPFQGNSADLALLKEGAVAKKVNSANFRRVAMYYFRDNEVLKKMIESGKYKFKDLEEITRVYNMSF